MRNEYDVPLENAYFCGFYEKMIGFVRSLFESALKTNPSLEFAVVILELKRVRRFTEMEQMCRQALRQIEERHYDAELLDEGYPVIIKYGICFCKKSCMVQVKE